MDIPQREPHTIGTILTLLLDYRLERALVRVEKAKAMFKSEESLYTANQLTYAQNYCAVLKDLKASIPKTLAECPILNEFGIALLTDAIMQELEQGGYLTCPTQSTYSSPLPNTFLGDTGRPPEPSAN